MIPAPCGVVKIYDPEEEKDRVVEVKFKLELNMMSVFYTGTCLEPVLPEPGPGLPRGRGRRRLQVPVR